MEEREVIGFILISMIGMLVLVAGFIVLYRVSKKQLIRQFQEKEALKSQHQQALLQAAIETQEVERKRIAAELHDHIGSNLQALKLFLHQVSSVGQLEQQSLPLLTETIQEVRNLSHELMPATLEQLGLQEALHSMCSRLNQSAEIACHFICESQHRLSVGEELAMYRIAQELISNTLKHAGARTINMTLTIEGAGFEFTYEDDGRGMRDAETSFGLGMKNMETRSQLIGAQFAMVSDPSIAGIKASVTKTDKTDE